MKNPAEELEGSTPNALEKILAEGNAAGGFRISVLTSAEGLPIAAAPRHYSSDLAAAMVGFLQKVSEYTESQLGMSEMDEATFRDSNDSMLVCRSFTAAKDRLVLATIAPQARSYRRITSRTIKQLKQILS